MKIKKWNSINVTCAFSIFLLVILQISMFEPLKHDNYFDMYNPNRDSIIEIKSDILTNDLSQSRGPEEEENYTIRQEFIIDDFSNEDKISYKKNVIVDSVVGGAKLLIINKTYGGSHWDEGWSVDQTSDNGYIITGQVHLNSPTNDDVWLIKTDIEGNMQWNRSFHISRYDMGMSVIQTRDGGYIIAGRTISQDYVTSDGWVIKTDSEGNMQWNKTYGTSRQGELFYSIVETSDGGYILSGDKGESIVSNKMWLLKINATGVKEWEQLFDEYGAAYSVQITKDNGYILTGGDNRVSLIKINTNGEIEWKKNYRINNSDSKGYSAQQTSDGGFIIIGQIYPHWTIGRELWLIKTNSTGEMEWNMTYGGINYDEGRSVRQTPDGGYIILGRTVSFGAGEYDVWLIKTDGSGNMLWNRTFGGFSNDFGQELQITSDGGYIFVGWTRSYGAGSEDVWIIKTDEFGNFNPIGSISSVNLLAKRDIKEIKTLNLTTEIPNGSSIKIQVSSDNINWYNSTNAIQGWEILTNGFNSIALTDLDWTSGAFFYRCYFSTENLTIPVLKNINLSFIEQVSSDITDTPDSFTEKPRMNDTDGDNIPDAIDIDNDNDDYLNSWEEFIGSDPLSGNDTPLDSDSDGEPDGDVNNTQPWMDLDDDNDMMPDSWEIKYNLNPKNSSDAYLDADNDTFKNIEEFINNTDPTNPQDPQSDDPNMDNKNQTQKTDFTFILLLGVILVIALLALIWFMNRKMKEK